VDVASLIQSIDYAAIAPVLAVAGAALAAMLVDLFAPKAVRRAATTWVSAAGLAVALALLLPLRGEDRSTFCTPPGGWFGQRLPGAAPPERCSYVVDGFTLVLQLVMLGGALIVVLLSARTVAAERLPAGEYHVLLLFSVSGAVTLAAARDLITLVLALEVVSLPAFALVGLRRDDGRASESALKFFLVSVVSTAVMLYGVSLVYGVTGEVHLRQVAENLAAARGQGDVVAATGVLLTLAGFAFKISAVPFHVWVPDTYVGAPLPIAAYLSVVSKAAGFAGLLLVVTLGFAPWADVWSPVLAVVAALTMTVGNLVALRQRHAVRLLAWSSVAQAGFILAPLGAVAHGAGSSGSGGGQGAEPSTALVAAAAYLAIYAVMNLGAFACVAMLAEDTDGADGTRSRGLRIADHRGLARRRPLVGGALAFFLVCLAGLPPGLVGLFAKVVVFRAVVDGGAGWLAVVMAVNTVVALVYYLSWTVTLFAEPEARTEGQPAARPAPVAAPHWGRAVALGATLALAVVFSVLPQGVLAVLDVARPAP
jgi:NADH-quinone oxidoreductase subunit N